MKYISLFLFLFVFVLSLPVYSAVVASDNADNAAYNDGWQLADNGGSGFNAWSQMNAGGGGLFMESSGGQVAGARSWGVYAGNAGTYAIARSLSDGAVDVGSFSVLARHNLNNDAGFSGFNIKSSSSAAMDANELVSFGLINGLNNSVRITHAGGTHDINFASELRGDVLRYTIYWTNTTHEFTIDVENVTEATTLSYSGTMKDPGNGSYSVLAAGVGNFNNAAANDQNLIFDNISLSDNGGGGSSVPEPASMALFSVAGALIFGMRSTLRKKTSQRH